MKKEEVLKIDPKAELRFIKKIEARADEDGKRFIEGEAAVVDSSTIINDGWEEYEEVIRKGAFDSRMNDDIRIVKNHSADLLLGRSRGGKGSGKVFINERGALSFSTEVRESRSHSVDCYDEILTGDIDGCSFMFRIAEEKWTFPNEENKRELPLREILDFEVIYDVGPVTYPYYKNTSVVARSANSIREGNKPNLFEQRKKLFTRKFIQNEK